MGTRRRSAELPPRKACRLGRNSGLVGSMEANAILPKGQKYIKPLRCSECGGNAVLVRRSPHPLDGLETRTFECQKCEDQTRRIVKA
jgi:hypothetical protein